MEAMQGSDKYNERVEVALRRSLRTEVFVAVGALATAALVAWLPVELEFRVAGLVWIAFVGLRALRRLRPGLRLMVERGGAIEVGTASGAVRAGSFVAPWLATVRWRPAGAWWDRTLLVAPDMLDADAFRRLRVLLRFGDRPLGPLSPACERNKGTDLASARAS